ncbi:MAG: heavy metal translocating P-type ATPase metal-binding domain-containing protein [Methylococcales bacterium]|nr:heavy metal translocating P-type ATPase metal-binding domain-containing protein [Methylococcales bacterium]
MSDKKEICDLCGLVVEVDGFKLKTKDGDKQFCCEGCKGIFQMLHEDQVLSEPLDELNN